MALLLGIMLSNAWINKRNLQERLGALTPDQAARINQGSLDFQVEYEKISSEVSRLRKENTRYQETMAKETGQTKLLNDSLQDVKAFAGITEAEGPGVTVTLTDLSGSNVDAPVEALIIHDGDVLRAVNELWNAGAEAIAVNGNRVVAGTSFRCVGTTILVNNVRIASPVRIQAIGDPETLLSAVSLPGGVFDELRMEDPKMVRAERIKKMVLPAYTGSTDQKWVKVPNPTGNPK